MARYRETVCLYYEAAGKCKKGREAGHEHYCQKCDKYVPRAKVRHKNRKKEKMLDTGNKEALGDIRHF